MSHTRIALTLVSCASLFACSAMEDPSSGTSTPRSLAKWVLVSPASPTMAPGQSLFLDAQMRDKDGQ